jgi:hypothetical protein
MAYFGAVLAGKALEPTFFYVPSELANEEV